MDIYTLYDSQFSISIKLLLIVLNFILIKLLINFNIYLHSLKTPKIILLPRIDYLKSIQYRKG